MTYKLHRQGPAAIPSIQHREESVEGKAGGSTQMTLCIKLAYAVFFFVSLRTGLIQHTHLSKNKEISS